MNPLDPKTTLTISTTIVLVLAILSMLAILFWAPDESRDRMLAGDFVLSSVILAAMRSLWSRENASKLLPIAFALALGTQLIACSPTQAQAHTQLAGVLHDTSVESRQLVRTWRTNQMRHAARAAHDAGAPIEEAQRAAQEASERAEPLVAAQRLYADAVAAYVDAVLLALAEPDGLQADDVTRESDLLLEAWRGLRQLGASMGIDAIARTPLVPPELADAVPELAALTGDAR